MMTVQPSASLAVPTHTPGPWRVDPDRPGIVRTNDDPTSGILVGLAANAHLVAAAPDMLALLQKLDGSLESLGREFRFAIREVIAKAEGRA